jgi:hypothetical protein
MAPVLRPRGEAGDANPSNRGHLPVRGIRHSMSSSEGEEEPRLTPVGVAMGPASVMARRALREQQQQAVQGRERRSRSRSRRRQDERHHSRERVHHLRAGCDQGHQPRERVRDQGRQPQEGGRGQGQDRRGEQDLGHQGRSEELTTDPNGEGEAGADPEFVTGVGKTKLRGEEGAE